MSMNEAQSVWETNDMALAVYLHIEGMDEQVIWRDGVCFWQFDSSEQFLQDCIYEFTGGKARVDPKEYNRVFYMMKQKMYSAEGSPQTRRNKG